jgi:UDP-glucuronate 4-epimerase
LLADGWDVTVIDNFDPFYPAAVKHANIDGHTRHPAWRLLEDRRLRSPGPGAHQR